MVPPSKKRPYPARPARLTLTPDEMRLLPGVVERLSSPLSSYSRPYDKDLALNVLKKMWVHNPTGKLSIVLTRGMDSELGALVTELLQCVTIPLARRAMCTTFLRMVFAAVTTASAPVAVPKAPVHAAHPPIVARVLHMAPAVPAAPRPVHRSVTWFVNPFRRQ